MKLGARGAQAMSVPLFATRPLLEPLLDEIAARQEAVLRSGRYILGPEVEGFEAEFAAYLGARHCVGVANGTDALTIALRALGVGSGDEVVVPALTFYATAEAVVNAGATPVFCDVDAATFDITAATVEPAISARTKAIVPVHLYGNPAPMAELRELAAAHDLRVLEDAAQAAGAKLDGTAAGALGDAATFSFFPSKNLGGFGDGGAIVTDDDEVAALARQLRFHGSGGTDLHTEVGYNSRLDEMQAAGLRVLLPAPRCLDRVAPPGRRRLRGQRAGRDGRRSRPRPPGRSPATTSTSSARPSGTGSPSGWPRPTSALAPTTRRRSTSSRPCATSLRRLRCRASSPPRRNRWRCRWARR